MRLTNKEIKNLCVSQEYDVEYTINTFCIKQWAKTLSSMDETDVEYVHFDNFDGPKVSQADFKKDFDKIDEYSISRGIVFINLKHCGCSAVISGDIGGRSVTIDIFAGENESLDAEQANSYFETISFLANAVL